MFHYLFQVHADFDLRVVGDSWQIAGLQWLHRRQTLDNITSKSTEACEMKGLFTEHDNNCDLPNSADVATLRFEAYSPERILLGQILKATHCRATYLFGSEVSITAGELDITWWDQKKENDTEMVRKI